MEFESGIIVSGKVITGARNLFGKIQTIYIDECTVRYRDEVLFDPSMGTYCMTVGKEIISAYAGPADDDSFDLLTHQLSEDAPIHIKSNEEERRIALFDEAKRLRKETYVSLDEVQDLHRDVMEYEVDNWLLFIDLFEVARAHNYPVIGEEIEHHLKLLASKRSDIAHLITEGLEMINSTLEGTAV